MPGRHAAADAQTKLSLLEQVAANRPARYSAIAVTATAVAVVPLGISVGQNNAQAGEGGKTAAQVRFDRASSQVITAGPTAETTKPASIVKVVAKPADSTPKLKSKDSASKGVKLTAKVKADSSAPKEAGHAASTNVDGNDLPISDSKWVRPVSNATISSEYGYRGSLEAAGGTAAFHNGIDFAAALGTPVHAANDGVVLHVGVDDFDTHTGGIVVILHRTPAGNFLTSYNHMRASDIMVDEGDTVKSGQVIAKVGSEGRSTGPHLHFSTRIVNNLSDPLKDWSIVPPREFMKDLGF
jgi:murein DD-endopeptidase MepM/ murein hydrolase activator NlpD